MRALVHSSAVSSELACSSFVVVSLTSRVESKVLSINKRVFYLLVITTTIIHRVHSRPPSSSSIPFALARNGGSGG